MLDVNSTYSRKGNIIYENDKPIIKLKQKFIDLENLKPNVIEYMNRYLTMFPDLWIELELM